MSTHFGVGLRIITPQGPVFAHDSDGLHFMAKLAETEMCSPACLPGCMQHGWMEVFPGTGWSYDGKRDVVVEVRPVMLPDNYYAGEDDDPPGMGDCSCPCSCHDHDCSDCPGCAG